jgi:hypothetical protein
MPIPAHAHAQHSTAQHSKAQHVTTLPSFAKVFYTGYLAGSAFRIKTGSPTSKQPLDDCDHSCCATALLKSKDGSPTNTRRRPVYKQVLTVGHASQQLHHAQHKEHVWRELLNSCLLDWGVGVEGVNLQTQQAARAGNHDEDTIL